MTKALFLDIDGVLQPLGKQERFSHLEEIPDLCKHLNETIGCGFDYVSYAQSYGGLCNIGAVYYDWDKPSVERLRQVLDATGAKIVLSSSWREEGMHRMEGMLAIHHLDTYLADATHFLMYEEQYTYPDTTIGTLRREARKSIFGAIYDGMRKLYPADPGFWGNSVSYRATEIREYLDRHPEITSYVALDDQNMRKGLDGHDIQTQNSISEENAQVCLRLLNLEDGPFPLDASFHTDELREWRENHVKGNFPDSIA